MSDWQISGRRRRLLTSSVALVALQTVPLARAQTVPKRISVLDTTAILVKRPSRAVLIAVTVTPGKRVVAVGEHGVVIYSDDNGGTWEQARVPADVTLTCVEFATAEIGWAAGHFGVVLKTEDSGKSWTKQLDGNRANLLTFQAAQDPDVQNSSSPGAPLAMARAQHFMDAGPVLPFLTMIVFSVQKILMLGAYRLAMLTNDGGETWQDRSLNIYFPTSLNIYDAARVADDYYLAAEQGVVFCSKDGGNTFLPSNTPAGTTLFGVLGAKDGSAIVFGVAGSVFRSSDTGTTWNTVQIDVQESLTAGRVMDCGDILLASEAGQIYVSKDNGNSFMPALSDPTQPLFDIQCLDRNDLLGVGPTGVTLFSNFN